MCAEGFTIVKDENRIEPLPNLIIFSSLTSIYTSVSDNDGKAQLGTGPPIDISVGDVLQLFGGVYNTFNATVISVESPLLFTVDLAFNGNDGGFLLVNDFLTFEEDPENLLSEVQVQILTTAETIVSVTFDGGVYVTLNDNQPINGLATFTFYVEKESLVNFVSSESVTITVTVSVP